MIMKKQLFTLFFLIPLLTLSAFGQNPIVLTFTGIENGNPVNLGSVNIHNLSKSCDTTLVWPNMVLSLNSLGTDELSDMPKGLHVFQNTPNPAGEKTFVKIYIPETGNIEIAITDFSGRMVNSLKRELGRGYHTFLFEPGASQLYIFTATLNSARKSIKIAAPGNRPSAVCLLSYNGAEGQTTLKSVSSTNKFIFSLGDDMEFTGYYNAQSKILQDSPTSSKTYTFDFSSGANCPATVTYAGKTYNTVQIGTQCWFKENLNIGTRINGYLNQTNNSTIEKYCHNDLESNCDIYGGLYQWDEAMQYSTTEGVQGICPTGWHIPTDAQWCTLTQYIDPTVNCNEVGWSGTDVGTKMKSTTGWYGGGNGTNTSGFSALPGGSRDYNGSFNDVTNYTYFWSSSQFDAAGAWFRYLYYDYAYVSRSGNYKTYGFSGRCLKD